MKRYYINIMDEELEDEENLYLSKRAALCYRNIKVNKALRESFILALELLEFIIKMESISVRQFLIYYIWDYFGSSRLIFIKYDNSIIQQYKYLRQINQIISNEEFSQNFGETPHAKD